MPNKCEHTCLDELDWSEIEQMHTATLQISASCYEYKKICVAFLAASITALISFTQDILIYHFIIIICIVIGFWISDATAYYYQRSLRNSINKKAQEIAARNNLHEYSRKEIKVSRWEALLNPSMAIYHVLLILSICAGIIYMYTNGT